MFGASKVKLVKFVDDSKRPGFNTLKLIKFVRSSPLAKREVKFRCAVAVTMKAVH